MKRKAARIERENIHKELQEGYKKHKDINLYTAFSATVDKYAIPLFKAGTAGASAACGMMQRKHLLNR